MSLTTQQAMSHTHSTNEDHAIFRRMPVSAHARLLKADRMDAEIMRLRSRASTRGARPADIQRNVAELDTENPADCIGETVSIVNGAWALKSPGQRDYEACLANEPNYHDGTPRKQWHELDAVAQWSWERDATTP